MSTDTISLGQLVDWLHEFGTLVNQNKAYLTELDSAIGDADHGANMSRGMTAVLSQIKDSDGPVDVLFKKVGMTLVSSVGGASGPLYGTFFMKFGAAAGTGDSMSASDLAAALRAGLDGIISRGKAEPGDKTMVDAMAPAVYAVEKALGKGETVAQAARAGAVAARLGREATTEMAARKGRASYLGERSKGHQDPGATSTAYLFEALAASVDGV